MKHPRTLYIETEPGVGSN